MQFYKKTQICIFFKKMEDVAIWIPTYGDLGLELNSC